MRERRGVDDLHLLAAGPGRLTQALGISGAHDGVALSEPPFELVPRTRDLDVIASPRVGISRATEKPWRYSVAGSTFVSRPRPRA
jgi:DNA-3-methyladenine glycosylase